MIVLRFLFLLFVVKPLSLIILGLNIRGKNHLPEKGPALIIANHNSHLDTIVLMSLFPIEQSLKIRPVAAAEYFYRNRFLKWFSQKIMGILPLYRDTKDLEPFKNIEEAFRRGEIIIFFPEGTRGKPEEMSPLKAGIYRLMRDHLDIPITPIFLSGLGKALPKNDPLLVPFHVNVTIGEAFHATESRLTFLSAIQDALSNLQTPTH